MAAHDKNVLGFKIGISFSPSRCLEIEEKIAWKCQGVEHFFKNIRACEPADAMRVPAVTQRSPRRGLFPQVEFRIVVRYASVLAELDPLTAPIVPD